MNEFGEPRNNVVLQFNPDGTRACLPYTFLQVVIDQRHDLTVGREAVGGGLTASINYPTRPSAGMDSCWLRVQVLEISVLVFACVVRDSCCLRMDSLFAGASNCVLPTKRFFGAR